MSSKKQNQRKKKSSGGWWLITAIVVVGVVAWWYASTPAKDPARDAQASQPVPGVNTLAPEGFTGKARMAYQVAKDIPQVLSKVPCFCGCMENAGHQSNLYCFTDGHGVG
jgi:hypothetical protein